MLEYCQGAHWENSEQRLLEFIGRMIFLIFENAVLGERWAIKPIKCRWVVARVTDGEVCKMVGSGSQEERAFQSGREG